MRALEFGRLHFDARFVPEMTHPDETETELFDRILGDLDPAQRVGRHGRAVRDARRETRGLRFVPRFEAGFLREPSHIGFRQPRFDERLARAAPFRADETGPDVGQIVGHRSERDVGEPARRREWEQLIEQGLLAVEAAVRFIAEVFVAFEFVRANDFDGEVDVERFGELAAGQRRRIGDHGDRAGAEGGVRHVREVGRVDAAGIGDDDRAEIFEHVAEHQWFHSIMQIASLDPTDGPPRRECAELLVAGFREMSPGHWNDLADGLEEVEECLALGPVRIALDGGTVAGWVGIRPSYAKVWELHPLVVDPARQRRGIGRALVDDICVVAASQGAMTVTLGTDDEPGWTSLAGVDLYPDPVAHLARIEDTGGHPFVFYLKCGFSVTGVTPDANGFGKPDIHMSRRVSRR